MPGRHRPTGRLSGSPVRTTLVVAAVAVIASGTIVALQSLTGAGGCGERDSIELPVAADPAIAPALRQIAGDWVDGEAPSVDGRCVTVDIAAVASADVANSVATYAGGFVDVAADAPAQADPPAVWVPDSSYWIDRLRAVSRTLFEPDPPPLASSPIVLGASPAGAELVGAGPLSAAALREPVLAALAAEQPPPVRLAEPRRDTAGLVGAGWLEAAMVTADQELPNLVATFRRQGTAPPDSASLLAGFGEQPRLAPVSEQAITAHNQAGRGAAVTAIPVEAAPSLDFPYTPLARQPLDVQAAAASFRGVLTSTGAARVFADHGFESAAAATPIGDPARLAGSLRIWTSATRDARVLSVVNVNASMDEPLGEARRIDVFKATAQQGLELFTANSQLGVWQYADELAETVPIGILTDRHRQRVLGAIAELQVRETSESAMFEALLAGYREILDGYDPARSNTLIVWTDSGNNQPAGPALADALRELEELADVTRPVRVVLLGLGPDADMTALSEIAEATGGGAFHLQDPDEIALIFLRALLT